MLTTPSISNFHVAYSTSQFSLRAAPSGKNPRMPDECFHAESNSEQNAVLGSCDVPDLNSQE